jgi:hypothetical protein
MKEINPEEFILKIPEEDTLKEINALFTEKVAYSFLVGAGISMDAPSYVPSARMFVKNYSIIMLLMMKLKVSRN